MALAQSMMRLAGLAAFILACNVAAGEVFVLTNGGQVVGELLNPDELPRETYAIKTADGSRITLARGLVKETTYQRPAEIEYERIKPRYPDTIEGQWALAEWCRENKLEAQRKPHLERILQFNPDHEQARRVLGYGQIEGAWQTREQVMENQGYVRYAGRWRLPQEVELLERDKKVKATEGEWKKKISQWRSWLGDRKTQLAIQNIRSIEDPLAVAALAEALEDDSRDEVCILLIEVLAKIGTPAATVALAHCAVEAPVEEVRLTCLDYLKRKEDPGVVQYFIGLLGSPYNDQVNLAAAALEKMGDPSSIGPLINALVTTHKFKRPTNPGRMTPMFGSGPGGGGTGLTMGDSGPKIIIRQFQNDAVRDALVEIAEVDFVFNVPQWRAWYAARKTQNLDARRD